MLRKAYELAMMVRCLSRLKIHGTDIAADVELAMNLVEMVSVEGQERLLARGTMGRFLGHWTITAWGWHACV